MIVLFSENKCPIGRDLVAEDSYMGRWEATENGEKLGKNQEKVREFGK